MPKFIHLDSVIAELGKRFFPTRTYEHAVQRDSYLLPSMQMVSWLFSNEGDLKGEHYEQQSDVFLRLGYSSKGAADIFKNDVGVSYSLLSKISGCFSFIKLTKYGIEAVTDSVGSHPLYFYENRNFTIISSRANFIAAFVEQMFLDFQINYSIEGCRQMALQGHFFGRYTGFDEIIASSVHEHITVNSTGIAFNDWSNIVQGYTEFGSEAYADTLDQMTNSLIDAFQFVKGESLHLSITGGRDSRLIASALHNMGDVDVTCATMGALEDPDVYIGKALAKTFGWHHEVRPRAKQTGNKFFAEDPIARVKRALDVHDSSTSAWDDFSDYGGYSNSPTMSGVGGEILRGGMTLTGKVSLSTDDARSILENTMCGGAFFRDDIRHSSKSMASHLLSLAEINPHSALDTYYHKHRNSRWVCARRSGNRTKWNVIDPLMDNALVSGALSVSPELRWSERLVFDLIRSLAPEIQNMPLEGPQWRFDREGSPKEYAIVEGASERKGFTSPTITATYDWRKLQDPKMRKMVKEYIFNSQSSIFEKIFDSEKLSKYIDESKYPQTIWHILTSVRFMSGDWKDTNRLAKNENILTEPPCS